MKIFWIIFLVNWDLSYTSCPSSLSGIPTDDQYGRPTCAIQYTGMGDPLPAFGCNGCMDDDEHGYYIHSGAVRQAVKKKFLPFGSAVIFEKCQLHVFENRDFSGTSVIYGAGIHPEIDPGPRGGLICASGWGSYRCSCAQADLMDEDSCPAAQKLFEEMEDLCAIRYDGFPGVKSNCTDCSSGTFKELILDKQEKSANETEEPFAFGSLLVNEGCRLTLFDDYEYKGQTKVYTEGSYSKILSGPMTHDDCKSFAWPSYKCQCGDPEEDYIEIEDIVKDENVLSGKMPLMQTILIAIGIAIIFVGVVLVLFKYHMPKQKDAKCLQIIKTNNQRRSDIEDAKPRRKVKKRPNVF